MSTHRFKPNKSQAEFYNSEACETILLSGIGGGKTHALSYCIYRALITAPGVKVFIGAPTYLQLRSATLVGLQRVWSTFGFIEGVNYVINKMPPASWNVRKFSDLSHSKILTTRWGSYAVLDGLENYDAQRGQEFDEIFIDESRDVSNEARLMLKGRLRGVVYTQLKLKHRIWHATSPPEDPSVFLKLQASGNKEIKFIFGNTFDNKDNLPSDYIESLKNSYDSETYERELMGRLIIMSSNPFAYAFKTEKHVEENCVYPISERVVYLSFDFNVDPNTCIAGVISKDFSYIRIIAEFRLRNSNVYAICEAISVRFPGCVFVVTGDATGKARHVTSKLSAWDIIWEGLRVSREQNFVPTANPSVLDTRISLNRLLTQHPNFKIASECEYLIRDLKLVQVDNRGGVDKSKDKHQSHLLDCLRYFVFSFLNNYRNI